MSFSTDERNALLALKGVGPTVIARLEEMGTTAWRNSPAPIRNISYRKPPQSQVLLIGKTARKPALL